MQFEFATATRIVFGSGTVARLPEFAREFGDCVLVVTGRNSARAAPIIRALEAASIEASLFIVEGEPTVDIVRHGASAARDRCHAVVGFGGGSAVDAAKAIAALATNSGEPLDYLETVGGGRVIENSPLPFIAIPTTAGTGAEVTRNAVLGSPEHRLKASLRSARMLAKAAIVDPDLTLDLPPDVTAATGLDALTQLIEPYVSCRANPLTDMFCVEGMKHISSSLARAYKDGQDRKARQSMSLASLLGGLALANAGLGAVHGFAAPLGGMLAAAHGALVAAVLPHGIAVNIQALQNRHPNHPALEKYENAARILTRNSGAKAEDLVSWIRALSAQLAIRSLRDFNFKRSQIPELADKASIASSMKANPIPLTREELVEIAEAAF